MFLPHERVSNIAVSLSRFLSPVANEKYREGMAQDAECKKAFEYADRICYADRIRYIVNYERNFMILIYE